MSINVAAEGEAHIEALGGFKDDAGGDAHAVSTIGFHVVFDGFAGEFHQLIGGGAIVIQELVVPSNGGMGLPLSAVVAVQWFGLGNETIAQLGTQGVVGCAIQVRSVRGAGFGGAGTMDEAVIKGCEGATDEDAMFLSQGGAQIQAAAEAGPIAVNTACVKATSTEDGNVAMAAHLLHTEAGAAKDGPAVPISGGVAGLGTKVQAFALHGAAGIAGALVVQGGMVAMGQAVGKGALYGTDDAAVMVGVAIAAIVLVGVTAEGHDDVAPRVVFGSGLGSRTKTAAEAGRRNVGTHAAHVHEASNGD